MDRLHMRTSSRTKHLFQNLDSRFGAAMDQRNMPTPVDREWMPCSAAGSEPAARLGRCPLSLPTAPTVWHDRGDRLILNGDLGRVPWRLCPAQA